MKQNLWESVLGRILWRSDISDHLATLSFLAQNARSIVEFGVRSGRSTCAFLHGLTTHGGALYSYDINADCARAIDAVDIPDNVTWRFEPADTAALQTIPECDILFLDTLHTREQVEAELRHHGRVLQFIVLHDTELFGEHGEMGRSGINLAVDAFLRAHPWRILHHFPFCNGLTILARV